MSILLEVKGLQKSFGGVPALREGALRLKAGTVHALCGGNGAGKSTFLKIVMGILDRDAGTIIRNGREVNFSTPAEALKNGISIVEQELSPVPFMTVAENIYLGREPVKPLGQVDFKEMNRRASALFERLGFNISPTARMMDLSVARIQLVEIAKALSYDAEVIIMDEPTSALGEQEAEHLLEAIARLKEQGKAVLYVSHRLSEIMDVADEYTVFRDGRFIEEGSVSDITKQDLVNKIVGRTLEDTIVKTNTPGSKVIFSARGIDGPGHVRDVSFDLHEGEILGVYGLMGSGRSEMFERLFGMTDHSAGEITLNGVPYQPRNPREAIEHGLAFVTEDRKLSGLVLTGSVRDNVCLATLPSLSGPFGMRRGAESSAAKEAVERFHIKVANVGMAVGGLSGGNQQKVVLGKWFRTNPHVLLLDEPTRGVDVGAKAEIYRIISEFTSQGGSVLMISSETEEILGLSDRALVMRDGELAGVLARGEMDAASLLHLAT